MFFATELEYKAQLILGHAYRVIGKIEEADKSYQMAKSIAISISNKDKELLVYIYQQLSIYSTAGRNDEVISNLTPLITNPSLSTTTKGMLFQVLGNVYRSAADWHNSIYYFKESIAIAKKSGDLIKAMERKAELGRAYRSSGCHSKALKRQKKFLDFALSRGDRSGAAAACGYTGFTNYSMQQPRYSEAVKYFTCRLELCKDELNDIIGYRWCLNNIGKAYYSLQHYEISLHLFTRSAELARQLGNVLGLGTAYGNMGSACRALNRHKEAVKYHALYLENAEKRLDTGGVSIMQNELVLDYLFLYQSESEVDKKEGYLNSARRYAFQALTTGLEIRSRLSKKDDLLKIANFEKNQAKTYALLQFILVKQGLLNAALVVSELGRARALTDLMEEKLNIKCSLVSNVAKLSENDEAVAEIVAKIGKLATGVHSHLLVYSIVDDPLLAGETWLYTWHVQPSCNEIHFDASLVGKNKSSKAILLDEEYFANLHRDIKVNNSQLVKPHVPEGASTDQDSVNTDHSRDIIPRKGPKATSKVSKPSSDIKQGKLYHEKDEDKMMELYRMLIQPMEAHIDACSGDAVIPRLVIIPQGFLFNVPYPALKGPNFYLIERFEISLSPSLSFLQLIFQKAAEKLKSQKPLFEPRILAVGNPKMPLDIVDQLPGAEKEVKCITSIIDGKMLLGEEATKAAVISHLPQYCIIHLATHAIVEDSLADHFAAEPDSLTGAYKDGDYSIKGAVILAKSGEECSGVLTSSEIEKMHLNCELFVLSCCNTARGKITGDGILGLSRSLMSVGATNLIVTLWRIHDSSSALLMQQFYAHYKVHQDAPSALRESILHLMKQGYKLEHWAAFCNLGISPTNIILSP